MLIVTESSQRNYFQAFLRGIIDDKLKIMIKRYITLILTERNVLNFRTFNDIDQGICKIPHTDLLLRKKKKFTNFEK